MALAMEGIRVLDMTIFQQGTYPGALFADLGADVIKVEGPDSPDPGRWMTNFQSEPYNAYVHSLNRGKRAICIDLKSEAGRQAFYRLVATADVFVSNLRRPALKRLGVDYETLSRINPRLVYARASAYGPKGPDADLGGMDILGQARGGIMSVTGDPSLPPRGAGAAIADHVGAVVMAFGIQTALLHRERTGEGQEVDASLLGGQLCIQTHGITHALWTGKAPGPRNRGLNPTWNSYEGSDGKWFAIGMNRDVYWAPVCKAMGRTEWLTDERFATFEVRLQHAEELFDLMEADFKTKPAAEWVRIFSEADLLATRINNYLDVAEDPQIIANEYIVDVERPDGGPALPMVSMPVTFSKTPGRPRGMAPEFGQHTEEVLLESGFDWDEIASLREAGAIGPRATSEAAGS
jgi:crotonobetainyl-CoA:carnitine CoA-transferase CaiB-like acyl-CoA transferase